MKDDGRKPILGKDPDMLLDVSASARSAPPGRVSEEAEVQLVRRCLSGDDAAWRSLFDRHFPSVYRFVSALGVPMAERDDAVQDVFIAVYRSLASFRGEAQLSTWIYRIAARHALRLSRRRRMREWLGVVLLREQPSESAVDTVERNADLAYLDRLLGRLSPKKRAVLVLFEIEGMPVEDIAQVVGCPVNTVWSRLHHARRDLQKLAQKSTLRRGDLEETAGLESQDDEQDDDRFGGQAGSVGMEGKS